MKSEFTGRHMAAILVAFFAVVIVINLAMAHYATSTFGGVTVENSYVASQQFNRWLDEAARERALGWQASAKRAAGSRIEVEVRGPATDFPDITAMARHPLGRLPDRTLTFASAGQGRFISREMLPPGRWRLRLEVGAAGQIWRTEQDLF